jgi:hypothetical protein
MPHFLILFKAHRVHDKLTSCSQKQDDKIHEASLSEVRNEIENLTTQVIHDKQSGFLHTRWILPEFPAPPSIILDLFPFLESPILIYLEQILFLFLSFILWCGIKCGRRHTRLATLYLEAYDKCNAFNEFEWCWNHKLKINCYEYILLSQVCFVTNKWALILRWEFSLIGLLEMQQGESCLLCCFFHNAHI